MNPFFFGASERALFGAYHAPKTPPGRNTAVVICNPFGDEAIKAHRALLALARMLSDERFHVLRFDYFGTGDSMGDGSEATATQWIEDIRDAATELRDISGVNKVSFAGLRLGASLALQAAGGRRDVGSVALWDPVIDGASYLRELKRAHEAYVGSEFHRQGPNRQASGMTEDEVMGFPLKGQLQKEIGDIDLLALKMKRLKRAALVVATHAEPNKALRGRLEEQGVQVAYSHVPVGVNWNADEAMESSLVPKEALQAIVDALI